ncbi:hypothetical protein [Mesobacillus foraminis]|uniref:hypothetical protein n=1 Tax=Mesobacillus foraminis TaxID=279826 RepID=UPI0013CE4C06
MASRVGYFFLFTEIPIAITATINVAKLIIKFIASYVTTSGTTPFLKKWRRPLPYPALAVPVHYITG